MGSCSLLTFYQLQYAQRLLFLQVHRARLLDGREVAVKIQYPGVAEGTVLSSRLKVFLFQNMVNAGYEDS